MGLILRLGQKIIPQQIIEYWSIQSNHMCIIVTLWEFSISIIDEFPMLVLNFLQVYTMRATTYQLIRLVSNQYNIIERYFSQNPKNHSLKSTDSYCTLGIGLFQHINNKAPTWKAPGRNTNWGYFVWLQRRTYVCIIL